MFLTSISQENDPVSFYDMMVENNGKIFSPSTTCYGEHQDYLFSFQDMLVGIIGTILSMTCWWKTLRRSFLLLKHVGAEHWDHLFSFYNILVENIGTNLSPSTICWCRTFERSFVGHDGGEHWDDSSDSAIKDYTFGVPKSIYNLCGGTERRQYLSLCI